MFVELLFNKNFIQLIEYLQMQVNLLISAFAVVCLGDFVQV